MKNKQDSIRDSIDLWSIYLPDCRAEMESCRGLLTGEELERASKFFKPKDSENFILSRGLLRRILGEVLDTDPAALTFERNEHGKPFLTGARQAGKPAHPQEEAFQPAQPRTEFNLSHSRDRLLIAVTTGRALGIDIEFRRSGINMNAIADRWFAPEEREFFQGLEKPEIGFFDIWAKKEAYVKALGMGIFKELHSFAVPLDGEPGFPMIGKTDDWFFQPLEIDPAYAAALVSEAPAVPIHLQML